MKAAAVQLAAHDRANLNAFWTQIEQRIAEAASRGAELIVLPEGTLPAYVLGYSRFSEEETRTQIDACSRLARELGCVIVIGAAHLRDGSVRNGALVFDRSGEQAGAAEKFFLWHFDRQWFKPANALEPVQTSIGKLGVLICADGRIPTISRTLVDRGAQILVMPTAWVTSGRDPQNLENVQADLLARVRARENGVPFIAANKCGVELGSVAYCGKSQIVSANGDVLALAPQDKDETIFADVALGSAQPLRAARTGSHVRIREQTALLNTARRVAIAAKAGVATAEKLRILEAEIAVTPETIGDFVCVEDAVVFDPAGLARVRLDGCDFAVWQCKDASEWQLRFARARALELRMYLVVLSAQRAYAVDPDGTIVCGTFGEYEIASFTYDPARSGQTMVAPGTDVLEGLLAVEQIR